MFKKIKQIIQRWFRKKRRQPYKPPKVLVDMIQQARVNDVIKKSEEYKKL